MSTQQSQLSTQSPLLLTFQSPDSSGDDKDDDYCDCGYGNCDCDKDYDEDYDEDCDKDYDEDYDEDCDEDYDDLDYDYDKKDCTCCNIGCYGKCSRNFYNKDCDTKESEKTAESSSTKKDGNWRLKLLRKSNHYVNIPFELQDLIMSNISFFENIATMDLRNGNGYILDVCCVNRHVIAIRELYAGVSMLNVRTGKTLRCDCHQVGSVKEMVATGGRLVASLDSCNLVVWDADSPDCKSVIKTEAEVQGLHALSNSRVCGYMLLPEIDPPSDSSDTYADSLGTWDHNQYHSQD
jgi:hypothetical protein